MKMKTVKRSLGIVLSMAMTMTLFGCGSDDATKNRFPIILRLQKR